MVELRALESELRHLATYSASLTAAEETKLLTEMNRRYADCVRDHLSGVLRCDADLSELANRSYKHAAGFDKLILFQGVDQSYRASIHVWSPDRLQSGYDQEVIHDHNMPFATTILTGGYTQELYSPTSGGAVHTAFVFGRMEYEPRGSHSELLRRVEVQALRAGESYSLIPTDLHRISGLHEMHGLTVSFFVQGKFRKDDVRLYVPGFAESFPIAERLSYGREELRSLLRECVLGLDVRSSVRAD